jgi:hypothetical protein
MKSSRITLPVARRAARSWLLVASVGAALLTLRCAAADPEPPTPDGTSASSGGDSSMSAGGTLAANSSGNTSPSTTTGAGTSSGGLDGSSGATAAGGNSTGVSAGGSSGAATTATAPTFAAVSALLTNNCAGSKCHGGSTQVNFTTASGLYSRLITPVASTIPHCAGTQLIAPGNTAGSFLLSVIQGKSTCKKGTGTEAINRMPDACSTTSTSPRACLTAAQIQTVSAWISAGAPQ